MKKVKHDFWKGIWTIKQIRDGEIIYEATLRNALADEGEKQLLETYFRSEEIPTEFYVRLCRDTLIETDTLTTVQNEPSGNGYTAQLMEQSTVGFPTLDLDAGDYMLTSKEITFTASGGDIGPVNTTYLATTSTNTGKLIAYVSLSSERTIADGDDLVIQFKIKLQ